MDIKSIESSLTELDINNVRIPNEDKNYFFSKMLDISKKIEFEDDYMPYDLSKNTFKKKFLIELKLLLSLDLIRLAKIDPTQKKQG